MIRGDEEPARLENARYFSECLCWVAQTFPFGRESKFMRSLNPGNQIDAVSCSGKGVEVCNADLYVTKASASRTHVYTIANEPH